MLYITSFINGRQEVRIVQTRLRSKVFSLGKILTKPKEKEKKLGLKKQFGVNKNLGSKKILVQKQILGHKKVKVKII